MTTNLKPKITEELGKYESELRKKQHKNLRKQNQKNEKKQKRRNI